MNDNPITEKDILNKVHEYKCPCGLQAEGAYYSTNDLTKVKYFCGENCVIWRKVDDKV